MTVATIQDYYLQTNWDKVLDKARAIQRGFIGQNIPAGIIKNETALEARLVIELTRLSADESDITVTGNLILRYDPKKDITLIAGFYRKIF